MRTGNRRLAVSGVAVVVAGLASCASPSGSGGTAGPGAAPRLELPATADASARAGQAIYARQCAACHGARGKGDGPTARKTNVEMPDLTSPDVAGDTDQAYFDVVTRGSKPMPAFRDRLGEKERWDVVHYVRAAFASGGAKS